MDVWIIDHRSPESRLHHRIRTLSEDFQHIPGDLFLTSFFINFTVLLYVSTKLVHVHFQFLVVANLHCNRTGAHTRAAPLRSSLTASPHISWQHNTPNFLSIEVGGYRLWPRRHMLYPKQTLARSSYEQTLPPYVTGAHLTTDVICTSPVSPPHTPRRPLSAFATAWVFILFARSAYRRVLRVSS